MQRVEGDFAATIHELKTSLTAIIASAELLGGQLHPDGKSIPGKLIGSITRNAHSLDEKLSLLSEESSLGCHPEPLDRQGEFN